MSLAIISIPSYFFAQDGSADSTISADTLIATDSVYTTSPEKANHQFDSLSAFDIPNYQAYDISDSILDQLKKDEAFWYVNKTPERQKPEKVDLSKPLTIPFYQQNWFRVLIWIVIIVAFIAVMIWFFIASDIRLFRKKATLLHSDTEIAISEDIFSVHYEEELKKAIATGNFRQAVRLMYLHILSSFAEKGIINYKIERTNSDYLGQLFNTSYYKDFFSLTRNFEYVWYGKFEISNAAFEMISLDYNKLLASL